MRYLGIDYGLKKIGLALSDEEGKLAFPHETLESAKDMISVICGIIQEEVVGAVVIGLPPEMPGGDTAVRTEIMGFTELLRKQCGVPTDFENEMFSTRIAERHSTNNADASAAAIVLQSFLDRRNKVQ